MKDQQQERHNQPIWISVDEAASLLQKSKRTVQRNCKSKCFACKRTKAGKYRILLQSLPLKAKAKYYASHYKLSQETEQDTEAELLANAPDYNRKKTEKYLILLHRSEGLRGKALREFIAKWNSESDFKTSYSRLTQARKGYKEQGISYLLGNYGKRSGSTKIADEYYEFFKMLYLKEGAPGLRVCWLATLGFAKKVEPEMSTNQFPSARSFYRRITRELPEESIFLSRYGYGKWKRRYQTFTERDYSAVAANQCWVSDHAQVDIAVELPNGRAVFPWVTAWRDLKTNKWLSWYVHPEAPNSDHIFQSFYHAAEKYSLPKEIYVDNGKDYRSRDFAGGRARNAKLDVDENRMISLVSVLGIEVHFAIPYNAQAKPIERDFLKNKAWFSKISAGYRGGNVTERPEVLAKEIKAHRIIKLDDFLPIMDKYVIEVLNRMPSHGHLAGMSPDEAWEKEYTPAEKISTDALKMFCMRTSKDLTIRRNGLKDSKYNVWYWGEWMVGMKGQKVYMRRDPRKFQQAWVFRADNDSYVGKAIMAESVPALAKTDIDRQALADARAKQVQAEKVIKAYTERNDMPETSEIISALAAGVEALNELRGWKPSTEEISSDNIVKMTAMDAVLEKERRMKKEGTNNLSALAGMPEKEKKSKIILFECDKK